MASVNKLARRARALVRATIESVEPRLMLSTYSVNTLSDAVDPGAGLLTLRQAVAEANANVGADTIAFALPPVPIGTFPLSKIVLSQGQITFSDTTGPTTLDGTSSGLLQIDANKLSRVFEITSGATVTIFGLGITGGLTTVADVDGNTSGGAILNAGTLVLNDVNAFGNAVIATGFSNSGRGVGLGGAIDSSGPLTLNNCFFTSNSVTDPILPSQVGGAAFGGAVYCNNVLFMNSTTVSGNTAAGTTPQGGASYTGAGDGGGIYSTASTTITSSIITGNSAAGGSVSGGESSGDGSEGSGGGIWAGGTMSIDHSTISGNSAIAGNGGRAAGDSGVARGAGIYAAGPVSITASTLSNNSVTGGDTDDEFDRVMERNEPSAGGGLYATSTAMLVSDLFQFNSVNGGPDQGGAGGGMYVAGQLTLQQSSISGNLVTASLDEGTSENRNGGTAAGGGIVAAGGGTISYSTVSNNSAKGGKGYSTYYAYGDTTGGDAQGAGVYASAKLTITNSTVATNIATGGEGGSSHRGTLPRAGAAGGDATGGGIYSIALLIVADSTITGNGAVGGQGGEGYQSVFPNGYSLPNGAAGAVSGAGVSGTSATFTNSIISGNLGSDIDGSADAGSANNLIGIGGGLTNGFNGNLVGITNPQLGTLQSNGGATQTMVPLAGSPAVNNGSNALVLAGITNDQRGLPRISQGTVDIGAVEVQISGTKLTGTVIGTSGSYGNDGNVASKAFDGNVNTFFDASTASGSWTGLDFGSAKQITSISYAPRAGWAARMVGGQFQGSNTANFSSGVVALFTVTSVPPTGSLFSVAISNSQSFRYFRYLGPANSYCNVAEINVFGLPGAATATPLTGTVIGTMGSFQNKGNIAAKAFDGILTNYFDGPTANGNFVGLDLGTAKVITQIAFAPRIGFASRMIGGIFQGSNSADFSGAVALYTVTTAPLAGTLTDVSVSNPTAFRYVRYLAPAGSYGNVAEVQFFSSGAGPVKFSGTVIGTAGSFRNDGSTISKAFDGNLATFFDAPSANGGWVGLDLGSSKVVTQVEYAPRAGWEFRMVGGEIQGSNSATFSSDVATLFTFTSAAPAGTLSVQSLNNTTAYRYYRYIGPANGYGNIAELEFDG